MIFVIAGFGTDACIGDHLPSVPLSWCHPAGVSRAHGMPPWHNAQLLHKRWRKCHKKEKKSVKI